MMLTKEEQVTVEKNMELVYKVVNDKFGAAERIGAYAREDLIQIGFIGLCKAVVTDKGGCFSTYAYRLIWHEICDALVGPGKRWSKEIPDENMYLSIVQNHDNPESLSVLHTTIHEAKKNVPESTRKGITALELMQQGYSSKEIAYSYGTKANIVCAWMSKARKYLKAQHRLQELAWEYGYGR